MPTPIGQRETDAERVEQREKGGHGREGPEDRACERKFEERVDRVLLKIQRWRRAARNRE